MVGEEGVMGGHGGGEGGCESMVGLSRVWWEEGKVSLPHFVVNRPFKATPPT